jgi:hypothetical protein
MNKQAKLIDSRALRSILIVPRLLTLHFFVNESEIRPVLTPPELGVLLVLVAEIQSIVTFPNLCIFVIMGFHFNKI